MSLQRTEYSNKNTNALNKLNRLLDEYEGIGIVKLQALPGSSFQYIRSKIRDSGSRLFVVKNTLKKISINNNRKNKSLNLLLPYVKESCALLFFNGKPFEIAKFLNDFKIPASARPGQVASVDVIIEKSNTGIAPGNFINELNSVGLPTKIERGTIAISKSTTVIEKGSIVSRGIANILSILNVVPFEVQLSLEATIIRGVLFTNEDLLKNYIGSLGLARQQAIGLAVSINYLSKDTIKLLIGKLHRETLGLISAIGDKDENLLPDHLKELRVDISANQSSEKISVEEEKEEETEEEESSEEDMGLGNLFG